MLSHCLTYENDVLFSKVSQDLSYDRLKSDGKISHRLFKFYGEKWPLLTNVDNLFEHMFCGKHESTPFNQPVG